MSREIHCPLSMPWVASSVWMSWTVLVSKNWRTGLGRVRNIRVRWRAVGREASGSKPKGAAFESASGKPNSQINSGCSNMKSRKLPIDFLPSLMLTK